ncbi:protein of unknown function [Shewanella benthica]|uniref:Uncharacterized protein n=1 Tax=Shewanella benthica TaxID=43661 RepID=A0A330M0Z5_9GAMM|nr:hypothetical protein [Shewanella benthica]SQH75083.1 protein of unknown function [Shewanella benthica]
MSVFAVIATDTKDGNVKRLEQLITTQYVDDAFKLKANIWLVYEKDVSQPKAVFSRLLGEDNSVACLIVPFDSYWGVQQKPTWDWLKNKGL